MTCVFLVLVLTPLVLILVYPDAWLMNFLYTSQAAVLGLVILATLLTIAIDHIVYGASANSNHPNSENQS